MVIRTSEESNMADFRSWIEAASYLQLDRVFDEREPQSGSVPGANLHDRLNLSVQN